MATKTIDNIIYITVPDSDGCAGCAAKGDNTLCRKLAFNTDGTRICTTEGSIWIKGAYAQDKPEAKIKTITTTSGTFQQAPVEGFETCKGCVAENNWGLCREICREHQCLLTPQQVWVQVQPVAPNIPEVLQILQEECAEVIQAVSKVQRFGLDNHHPERNKTNKQELEEELGDLLAMIQILTDQNFLDKASIALATQAKTQKLKQYSTVWTQNKPNN